MGSAAVDVASPALQAFLQQDVLILATMLQAAQQQELVAEGWLRGALRWAAAPSALPLQSLGTRTHSSLCILLLLCCVAALAMSRTLPAASLDQLLLDARQLLLRLPEGAAPLAIAHCMMRRCGGVRCATTHLSWGHVLIGCSRSGVR